MNFALVGDIALNGLISSQSHNNRIRYHWIANELSKYSGVFANLEAPVFSDERNVKKNYFLFSDEEVTRDILKRLNVICVSLANNHIFDCGMGGVINTIHLLDESGIYHTGAGFIEEHIKPVIFSLDGVKIGFTAYVDLSTNPLTESYNDLFINYFSEEKAIKDLKSLKGKVDIIICSIHWGIDYSFFPEQSQIKIARKLIEEGANIIMGHHSHTLQPFESYKTGQIFYGLGGVTFGDFYKNDSLYSLFRKTKDSAIFGLDQNYEIVKIISTFEKKGNIITPGRHNVLKRNKRLWTLFRIREHNMFFRKIFMFNEQILSRIYEYFFGYYMNPLHRLFQIGNVKKLGKLFREIK